MKTPHFPVHRHRPRRPLVGDNTHLLYNNSHRRPLFFILDTGVEIAVQAINLSTLHRGFIAGAFVRSWRQTEPWPDCISCHFLSQVRECPCRGAAVRICRGLRARAPSQRGGRDGWGDMGGGGVHSGSSLCGRQIEQEVKKWIPHSISLQELHMNSV